MTRQQMLGAVILTLAVAALVRFPAHVTALAVLAIAAGPWSRS